MELCAINPHWEVKLWHDDSLLGVGIDTEYMLKRFWSPASASNMIRLKLIQKYGGIYLDMDMEPLLPIDSVRQVYGHAFACDQGDGRLCNAAFGAPPDHPWINWQIEHGPGDCDPHDAAWGVYTMTKAPREMLYVVRTNAFFPYHYSEPEELRKPHPYTICEHKWHGSWTKK